MKSHTILTKEGYEEMADKMAETVAKQHTGAIRDAFAANGGSVRLGSDVANELTRATDEDVLREVQFSSLHPDGLGGFGLSHSQDVHYLASIYDHAEYAGHADLPVEENDRLHKPDRLDLMAIRAMYRDVRKRVYDHPLVVQARERGIEMGERRAETEEGEAE